MKKGWIRNRKLPLIGGCEKLGNEVKLITTSSQSHMPFIPFTSKLLFYFIQNEVYPSPPLNQSNMCLKVFYQHCSFCH